MASFRFRARNERGHIIRGERDAADLVALREALTPFGLTLLDATDAEATPSRRMRRSKRLTLQDRAMFCTSAGLYLRAGMSAPALVEAMLSQAEQPVLRQALTRMLQQLQQGASLAEAAAHEGAVLSSFITTLLKVGEQSGQLAPIMEQAAAHLRHMALMRAEMRQKLRSPCITLIFTSVALACFMPSMVGKIALLAWLAAPVLAYRQWPAFAEQVDGLALRTPVLGTVIHCYDMLQWARCLKLTTQAGLPLGEGLVLCAAIASNRALRHALEAAGQRVQQGSSPAQAFLLQGDFSPRIIRALQASERTGQFEQAMDEMAHFYQRDLEDRFDALHEWLRLVVLVLAGFAVLGLAHATGRL